MGSYHSQAAGSAGRRPGRIAKVFFPRPKDIFGRQEAFFPRPKDIFGRQEAFFPRPKDICGRREAFFPRPKDICGRQETFFPRPKDILGRQEAFFPRPRDIFGRQEAFFPRPKDLRRRQEDLRPGQSPDEAANFLPQRRMMEAEFRRGIPVIGTMTIFWNTGIDPLSEVAREVPEKFASESNFFNLARIGGS